MSHTSLKFQGAMTALITPFREGKIDIDALRALVERQIESNIDGLVPCGTTGESATMSEDECVEVIRTVVDQAQGRVPIIAGTGSNDTYKTIQFTKRVAKIKGVDAALVVCPYYNKPNQSGLMRHFTQIADEGGLPVVLYNVPGRSVVSMTANTVATLADHEHIVALKEASGDMRFDAELLCAVQDKDFSMLSGDDFTTMPFVAQGGDGCISVLSNLDPHTMHRIVHLTHKGELVKARRLHLGIQELTRHLFMNPNPVPAKEIAAALGWCSSEVRAPLYNSDEDFVHELHRIATSYGLIQDA